MQVLFCQCGRSSRQDNDGYGADYPHTKEAYDVIDSCMMIMRDAPEEAHHILDSLCHDGLISPQRCKYLHALVVYKAEEHADSALSICRQLLEDGNFGDDRFIEEEICELASNITLDLNRYLETLKYANRGISLCHGDERMRSDEVTLMARVGVAEQELGRTAQARQTYAAAYEMLQEDKTFGGLIALISLKRKQASLYFHSANYAQALSIYKEVLDLVRRFDNDPSFVLQRPETMRQSGDATHEFADFYESQIYCNMACIYRTKVEKGGSANPQADTDSAKLCMERWNQTVSSQSPSSRASALRELYFTGRMDVFDSIKAGVGEFYKGDSLVAEYVDYLSLMSDDAASHSDFASSRAYLQRALVVSDSIRRREVLIALAEEMSLNMVQEQRLARQDAEYQLSRHKTIITQLLMVMAVVLVAGIIIVFLVFRNRRNKHIIEMTQHDLSESKEEVKELTMQLEEMKNEKSPNTSRQLFQRIESIMMRKKLYLNPDLDINMLADEVCSSRTLISVCINSITGRPFRQWLSEYRLTMFVEMMGANPDEPIENLMRRCGYKDQSTFRRQFKATYGMTAVEYKRNILGIKV